MYEDYEDYGDFLDNPPRLITCPRGNATAPRDDEGDPSQIDCVDPFLLDGRRRRFSEPACFVPVLDASSSPSFLVSATLNDLRVDLSSQN